MIKKKKKKNKEAISFPDSSVGKESACNAGILGLIPGWGRSPGEGIGYPLQYSWTSLVAQLLKNPPAMQETWVRSLGWEDPLETGMATHSSILGLPCGSAGKESAHNAGDLSSIPGLGRSPGEGKGCQLQYSGLENSIDSSRGRKDSDTTEQISLSQKTK